MREHFLKYKILFILIALVASIPALAQKQTGQSKERESKHQEMLELKIGFLSDEIDLKEDQKKPFAETYSQMETERRAIYKRIKKAEKSIRDNKDASEADYEKASKDIAAAKAEMSQVEKKYDERFAAFLTKKQLYKLKEAESKFTQKMQDCRDKKKHEGRRK